LCWDEIILLGDYKTISPIIPKKWYGDIPIISYWGVFIGELLEMLRTTLFIQQRLYISSI